MLAPEINVAFIGGGNMAEAMISGLIASGHSPKKILVCAPSAKTQSDFTHKYGILTAGDNTFAAVFADVIVLAVKPHVMPVVCAELKDAMLELEHQKLVISVAAGVSHTVLREALGGSSRIICAMPNLPSAVGQGMTGLYASEFCDVHDISLTESLMSTIGQTLWLQEEHLMTSMVAASGSSPAYFFLIMEAMQKVAIEQGMTANEARLSVQQAAFGAVSMAVETDLPFDELRKKVASPKGTTEQALEQFYRNNIEGIVRDAMTAAAAKAKENYQKISS